MANALLELLQPCMVVAAFAEGAAKVGVVTDAPAPTGGLDPVELALNASAVGKAVLALLLVFSVGVWVIWLLKSLQLGRLTSAQRRFERQAEQTIIGQELVALALKDRSAAGARVVLDLAKRREQGAVSADLLLAVARRSIATEQQRAAMLMPLLASIASSAPFIGLFGTVWGIMEAFHRIGVEKSASLPVVAPAIAEALIATAVGLVAAIPATIGYNFVDRKVTDFVDELTASSEAWAQILADGHADEMPAAAED